MADNHSITPDRERCPECGLTAGRHYRGCNVAASQIAIRFWRCVRVGSADECWLWKSGNSVEYPKFWINGKKHRANRVAWELHNGKSFPEGLLACHTCDTTRCVNPHHIYAGTPSQNVRDTVQRKRRRPTKPDYHRNCRREIVALQEELRTLRNEIAALKGENHEYRK